MHNPNYYNEMFVVFRLLSFIRLLATSRKVGDSLLMRS